MIDFKWFRRIVLLVFLVLISVVVNAQGPPGQVPGGGGPLPGGVNPPCPPGSNNPGCTPIPPNPVPITGIEILLGAGALLGARKYVQGRKKEETGA